MDLAEDTLLHVGLLNLIPVSEIIIISDKILDSNSCFLGIALRCLVRATYASVISFFYTSSYMATRRLRQKYIYIDTQDYGSDSS